ncbi:MAG: glycerophosphodiester phosphodiesterase family protein [Bacteroidales bacterium]|nr:glycerophosphodiester phosphodiesterase family protein [Bacteroidales bacterium]
MIATLIFFCCKKERFVIENLSGNRIHIVGHAGMGFHNLLPKNSYEALMKALNLGADGVEMDVQMTKDSVLVLFHDEDLSPGSNMRGRIYDYTWSELQHAYHVKVGSPLTYSLISLDELFSNIPNLHRYSYTFDNKLHPISEYDSLSAEAYINTHINALIRIVEKYDLSKNANIESYNTYFLTTLKQKKPNYRLFAYLPFDEGLEIALALDLYGITIESARITKEQVQLAHQHHIRSAVFDANSNGKNIEAIRKSPDIIQTDRLEHLLKTLR